MHSLLRGVFKEFTKIFKRNMCLSKDVVKKPDFGVNARYSLVGNVP